MNIISKENSVFELKGSLFTLTVLHLTKPNLVLLDEQLSMLISQTPRLFHYMPLIIDLHKLQQDGAYIDFNALNSCLRRHHIIPIGVRGGTLQQHEAAATAGLAVFPNTKAESSEPPPVANSSAPQPQQPLHSTKVITHPVRSGQQIYARHGDLIVLAPVSPGAELLADYNIHVYSALRGRALAGVTGNPNSRIFCQHLEAELVAIAGHYWVSEDLQNSPIKQRAHIYLDNDKLHMSTY